MSFFKLKIFALSKNKIQNMFLYHCLQWLNPFSDIYFYFRYLATVDRLQADRVMRFKFRIFLGIFLLKSVHFAVLFACPLTPLQRLLNYDVISLVINISHINVPATAVFLMITYLYWAFYVYPARQNNRALLAKVQGGSGETSKSDQKIIRQKLVFSFNLIQSFTLIMELVGFASSLLLAVVLFRQMNFSSNQLWWPCFLAYNLYFLGCTLFFNVSVYHYFQLISLVISIGSVQMALLSSRLKEVANALRPLFQQSASRKSCKCSKSQLVYRFYRREIVAVLRLFSEYNALYGRLFTVFILFNLPLSCYFLVLLLFNSSEPLPLLSQAYLGSYSVLQVVVLFAVHLYFTQFIRRFEAPTYLLMRHSGRQRQVGRAHRRDDAGKHLQLTLQVANSVQTLLTTRPVGMTYDRFGLVTLRAFVAVRLINNRFLCACINRNRFNRFFLVFYFTFSQFLLLYGKFILITFKIVNSS